MSSIETEASSIEASPIEASPVEAFPVEESVLASLGGEPGSGPASRGGGDELETPGPATAEPVFPEPEAFEAAAPKDGDARPGDGKKFVFGNAAEELELAMAQMRRGDARPSSDEDLEDRAES